MQHNYCIARRNVFVNSLNELEIRCRCFAFRGFKLVAHRLAFVQIAEARTLNGADVNEHVASAVVRLDKSKTFCWVEPLYFTGIHSVYLLKIHSVECCVSNVLRVLPSDALLIFTFSQHYL